MFEYISSFIGDLKTSTSTRTCVLTFHIITNVTASKIDETSKVKVIKKSLQNRCQRNRAKTSRSIKKSQYGPWSKCLSTNCNSLNAIEVRRRFCPSCGYFNYEQWLLNGAGIRGERFFVSDTQLSEIKILFCAVVK